FRQALDAAAYQGNTQLTEDEKINFKFLKAGMGFFAAGLQLSQPEERIKFEHARLKGIEQALNEILKYPDEQRKQLLGKIKRIELPFSASVLGIKGTPPEISTLIESIKEQVEK